MQTLRVNNSRILTIKNAKFSEYYFYIYLGDFQICISVALIKLQALFAEIVPFRKNGLNFNKKRRWNRCFPVNFRKLLRKPFLQNTTGRLLLIIIIKTKSMLFYKVTTSRNLMWDTPVIKPENGNHHWLGVGGLWSSDLDRG